MYELYAASAERGRSAHREWDAKVEAFLSAGDAAAVELRSLIKGELPEGWKDALPVFEPDDAPLPIVAVARGIDRSQLVQRIDLLEHRLM